MCGNKEVTLFLLEFFYNGQTQCRSFHRISSCSKLIKQNYCLWIRFMQTIHNIRDVRRKSAQILLDALLITYINYQFRNLWQNCFLVTWKRKTTHHHYYKKAYRFQSNGFTTRVRSRQHHAKLFLRQMNIYRNNIFR